MQPLPDKGKGGSQFIPHAPQRLIQLLGDFVLCIPFKDGEVQNLPLWRGELRQRLSYQSLARAEQSKLLRARML